MTRRWLAPLLILQGFTHLVWLSPSAHSGQAAIPWMMNRGLRLFGEIWEQHAPGASLLGAAAQSLLPFVEMALLLKLLNTALVLALTLLIYQLAEAAQRRGSGGSAGGAGLGMVGAGLWQRDALFRYLARAMRHAGAADWLRAIGQFVAPAAARDGPGHGRCHALQAACLAGAGDHGAVAADARGAERPADLSGGGLGAAAAAMADPGGAGLARGLHLLELDFQPGGHHGWRAPGWRPLSKAAAEQFAGFPRFAGGAAGRGRAAAAAYADVAGGAGRCFIRASARSTPWRICHSPPSCRA